jgi:hypothetical protein
VKNLEVEAPNNWEYSKKIFKYQWTKVC